MCLWKAGDNADVCGKTIKQLLALAGFVWRVAEFFHHAYATEGLSGNTGAPAMGAQDKA